MPRTLVFRAVLALVLMAIYFALAVGSIAGLCWLGWWSSRHLLAPGHTSLWLLTLGIASFVGAGVILWSTFPRFDKFQPPGPEVTAADQPALFAEIARICALTGVQMPRHVYLMFEMNAFVAQRGGIMGFGSQRMMGVGLPLLRVITISELRAVLAHEMGHFAAGDTRLSPWIYKTRNAVRRTHMNLVRVAAKAKRVAGIPYYLLSLVIAPFNGFGIVFMRITQSISRAQELSADRLAARVAGVAPLVGGFKKTHGGVLAHQMFLRTELAPLVEDGRLPPVGEGFTKFMQTKLVLGILDDVVAGAMEDTTADPYDSHPPLRERIAALDHVEGATTEVDPRPAIELVIDADEIEHRLVTSNLEKSVAPITWAEVSEWWIARWRRTATRVANNPRTITIGTIPNDRRALRSLCESIEGRELASRIPDESIPEWAQSVLGTALCVGMMDAGFTVENGIGEPVVAHLGDVRIEPLVELGKYLAHGMREDDWVYCWNELGLADLKLA